MHDQPDFSPARRRFLTLSTVIGGAGAMAGCVTRNGEIGIPGVYAVSFTTTTPRRAGASIGGQRVAAYSFLEARVAQIGPQTLSAFERELPGQLGARKVQTTLFRLTDSAVAQGRDFSKPGVQFPVRDVIAANADAERALGARYRLVIVPVRYAHGVDGWTYMDIVWDVVDIQDGQTVWAASSHSKLLPLGGMDANAGATGARIVSNLVDQLAGDGML